MNEGQTQQPLVGRRCYNCQYLPSFNADPAGAYGHCIKNNHRVSVDDCCGHFRRRAAAPDVADAPIARKTAFDCSALLDLLAVSWEAEAELLEGRLDHDPFRTPREMISCDQAERMRTEASRLRKCAADLREVVGGLASKSNTGLTPEQEQKIQGGRPNGEGIVSCWDFQSATEPKP